MTPQDYLRVILVFASIYMAVTLALVGHRNPKVREAVAIMTPMMFVSICCMAMTGLGYIR